MCCVPDNGLIKKVKFIRSLAAAFLNNIGDAYMPAAMEITIKRHPQTDPGVTQRKFYKKTARGKVIKGQVACAIPTRDDLLIASCSHQGAVSAR